MKIIITQTRQINPYEPRKIEIEFDTNHDHLNWKERAREIVDELDEILYPEKYVEFHQDPPCEVSLEDF